VNWSALVPCCGNFLPVYSISDSLQETLGAGMRDGFSSFLTLLVIASGLALAGYLVLGCWQDFRKHQLSNQLNYSFLLVATILSGGRSAVEVLLALVQSEGSYALGQSILAVSAGESLLGGFVCFVFTFVCWRFGLIGGGDVKFAAVIGAFLGPWGGIIALVLCHILAMVTVTLDLVSRHLKAIHTRKLPSYSQLQVDLKREIPMAGFYAIGVMGYLLGGFTI
jgi:Flp pilus assembly protein protease CpaA